MRDKEIHYEDYLMACLGNIEERYHVLSQFKDEINTEADNYEELKMNMIFDMEESFDRIDSEFEQFVKHFQ